MSELEKFDDFLKHIEVPEFNNKKNEKEIINLISKIDKRESLLKKEKETLSFFKRPIFKYAFSFTIIFIILFFGLLLFPKLHKDTLFQNDCVVKNINGIAYLYNEKDNKQKLLNLKNKINKSSIIRTDSKSFIDLLIGNNSLIRLKENSELKIPKLYRNKNNENTKIFLVQGKALFKPLLSSTKSSFEVETEAINVSTIGTEFVVITDNFLSTVALNKGKLSIRPIFNVEGIKLTKKLNKEFGKNIENLINHEIILHPDNKVMIKHKDIINAENDISKITFSINKYLEKNKDLDINQININKELDLQINKINLVKEKLIQRKNVTKKEWIKVFNKKEFNELEKESLIKTSDVIKNEKNDIKTIFNVTKLLKSPGVIFSEKHTAITSNSKNIYITCNINDRVFCVNPYNGKTIWKFSHKNLIDITSPAVFYNNQIILTCPNNIFILKNNGELTSNINIEKGPNYWTSPLKTDKGLFIPTSNTIYSYTNDSLTKLENLPNSLGSIFISYNKGKLYCNYMNEKKIRIYNLEEKKIVWESDNFQDRSFMKPLLIKNNVFIGDASGNIYKFDLSKNKTAFNKINIGSGIISDMVYKNNYLYLIAKNGWFYRLYIDKLGNVEKITKVDDNPQPDKYLIKNLLINNNDIFFCSDNGRLFRYNIAKNKTDSIIINDKNLPLIASPVKINESIFVVDIQSNIYKITKNIN